MFRKLLIKKKNITTLALLLLCTLILWHFGAVVYAGVGGGVEAREKVDIVPLIKWTLVFLAGLAVVFGLGLAFAAKKFAVQVDPRVEQVLDVLAHAHCGACGYAGCEQYAEAVVKNPDVSPSLCIPAGAKSAEAVARITGKAAAAMEPQFARIM
ncbi:MAG: RnfABCDGE type electron transport complex subunit B, partial [Nitrospirota bacterium]